MYYHASGTEGIEELQPRVSNHGVPLVYLSEKRENVLVYLSNAVEKYCRETGFTVDGPLEKWGPYGFDRDGILRLEEYYPGATEKTYKGVFGYIYGAEEVQGPGVDAGIPGTVTSERPVKVTSCEYVPDALEELLSAEREGKIRIKRYEAMSEKDRQWIRETMLREYAGAAEHPEYRHFLEGMFPWVTGEKGESGVTLKEAMEARHSVRAYTDEKVPEEIRKTLSDAVSEANREGDLHISIRWDDPEGFDSRLAHYGNFRNVSNYIVLAGKKSGDFDLRCGYYGEKLVLLAQSLGLNTCWAALTFNKRKVKELLAPGESLCMVIALGYGASPGHPHRGKAYEDVCDVTDAPAWFREGVEAALLAPTAVNQQKFFFSLEGEKAVLRAKGIGTCLQTDLGIVKYHFEAASGHEAEVR